MKEDIFIWCMDNSVDIRELTPYQCRFFKDKDIVFDIYWKSKRYHIIKHSNKELAQVRGDVENWEIFLEKVALT